MKKKVKNNRRKGHNWERTIRTQLKEIYPEVQTSRYASRIEDDNGVDLVNTGCVAIQAKNVKGTLKFDEVFDHMKTDRFKVIAYKNNKIRGSKGEYAVILWEDFIKLLMDLEG